MRAGHPAPARARAGAHIVSFLAPSTGVSAAEVSVRAPPDRDDSADDQAGELAVLRDLDAGLEDMRYGEESSRQRERGQHDEAIVLLRQT